MLQPSAQTPLMPPAPQPSLRGLTFRALGWAGAASALAVTISLLRLIILSRLLTPTEFGVFAAGNSLAVFMGGLAQALFAAALLQDRSGTEDPSSVVSGLVSSILFGGTLALLIWIFSAELGAAYRMADHAAVFTGIAPVLVLRCMAQVPWALLQRDHRFRSEFVCTAASLLVGTVVSTTLAWHGFGFHALVWGLFAETAVLAFAALMLTWSTVKAAHPTIGKAWNLVRRFGGSYSVTFVSGAMHPGLQCFLVSFYHSPLALGLFTRTQALNEAFAGSVFGTFVNRLFRIFPLMRGDSDRLGRAMAISVELIALVTLPVSAMLFFSADSVVRIVLGPSWSEAALLFGIFSLGLMARLCYKVTEFVSYALGRAASTGVRSVANLVMLGVAIVAVARYGLVATVAAVVAVGMLNYLFSASIAVRGLGWSWMRFAALHLRGAALVVLVVTVFLALRSQPVGPIASDALACFASMLLIALCCWAFPTVLIGQRLLDLSPRLRFLVRR